MIDIKNNENLALDRKKVHKRKLEGLKKQRPGEVDQLFHTLHQEVFEEIDCLECANCCKAISPRITARDIEKMTRATGLKKNDFIDQYLQVDDEGDYVFKQTPCPFLSDDNYCQVYEDRPVACSGYPHTDRRKMHQILGLTLKNARVCPAVFTILESMGTAR